MSMQSYVVATPSTTTHAHATDYKVLKICIFVLFTSVLRRLCRFLLVRQPFYGDLNSNARDLGYN